MKKITRGIFLNGDEWTGACFKDDGEELEPRESLAIWFEAICQKTGLPYITQECPKITPLFTIQRFQGAWTEQEIETYRREHHDKI